MKPKTLIPLVLGLVIAGVAIKIVFNVVNKAQAGTAQVQTSQCIVAAVDINFAEEITPEKLAVRDWPKNLLPAGSFHKVDDLKSRVANMSIPKDVPVSVAMLAAEGTPPGIQTRIRPGFRAVSIEIDEVSGVAGLIKPGDFVDIVSLVKQNDVGSRSTKMLSRIILQNVEIAAVGKMIQRKKEDEAPTSLARSVTVLLKPNQVAELHLAKTSGGKLSLALRSSLDSEQEQMVGVSIDALLGLVSKKNKQDTSENLESDELDGQTHVVTTVRGNDIEVTEYVRENGHWVRKLAANGDEKSAGGGG